jgi:hypothetical protein
MLYISTADNFERLCARLSHRVRPSDRETGLAFSGRKPYSSGGIRISAPVCKDFLPQRLAEHRAGSNDELKAVLNRRMIGILINQNR